MKKPLERAAARLLADLQRRYPVITLTGPRQAGKTTLCRMAFPSLPYANLEEPDVREFAQTDPRGFLARYPGGGVIDEFQRAPDLTSYIQSLVDAPGFEGTFVLTGSRNLAIRDTVSQSLAGRTALVCLLPFSYSEIAPLCKGMSLDQIMLTGFYPRIYDRNLNPTQALADYVGTYVERDLRQLSLIRDLSLFQKFLGLCAGRIGQLLNLESLGNDTGVSHATARQWLSLMEASYIAFRLAPFHANTSKRLIKSPKLFFYDVGLAAYLMGITTPEQIPTHPMRGRLYENLIVVEVAKFFLNRGPRPNLTFYRDSNGNEVDLVVPRAQKLVPIEIKSAATVTGALMKGLGRFAEVIPEAVEPMLVYAGDDVRVQDGVRIVNLPRLDAALCDTFATGRRIRRKSSARE
ncbi:MAG: ATP-binding protein [Kiritimatiellae bacterium]|nr:ATP-binding protein [Kiritimatiellia bacterium]